MNNKRVTVTEIARLSGVSIGTVDRVLHDRGGVSAETKSTIKSMCESLGYRPNLMAKQLSLNKNYSFRALFPRSDQDSGYWALCRAGIERAASELSSFRVHVKIDEFDRHDGAAYRSLLDTVVAEPGDGILVAPALPDELSAALRRLPPDFPYVFFDGSLEGASPRVSIGQDAYAGGFLAGRMMSLLVGGQGLLVAINAHAEDRHIGQRIEGYKDFFKSRNGAEGGAEAPAIKVLRCFDLEEPSVLDAFLSGLFLEKPSVAGILVANASGHLVGEWLARKGKKAGCGLVSWDLVPANVAALRRGTVDCILSQHPYEQGREGLDRLFKAVVLGEAQPARIDLPLEIYFKENLPSGREDERNG